MVHGHVFDGGETIDKTHAFEFSALFDGQAQLRHRVPLQVFVEGGDRMTLLVQVAIEIGRQRETLHEKPIVRKEGDFAVANANPAISTGDGVERGVDVAQRFVPQGDFMQHFGSVASPIGFYTEWGRMRDREGIQHGLRGS